ncbi:MAG: hypothetical protein LLG13_02255 [Bacteroidales bacterium]|nr:hypothetical protein [Bacteroidales bacterium]
MKKPLILTIWVLLFLLINSCSATRRTVPDQKLRLSVQGGANLGGITENTDMTVVPNIRVPSESTVDAFTGATKLGYNIGAHLNKKLKNNQIETGLDYMYNYQTFNYNDAGNFYSGVRRLQVSQFMLPLTYNFVLLRKLIPKADIQLKIGLTGQLNSISTNDTGISLPSYSINHWSIGPIFGLSAYLFQFQNGNKLGIFFDVYRGSQIYEDYYNQSSFEIPGSSFMKFGLRYQF